MDIINEFQNSQLGKLSSNGSDTGTESPEQKYTYTFSEMWREKDEETKFLVPDLIPDGEIGMIIGEDGIGKTRLMSQLALDICTGKKHFLGLELNAPHKRVLFVSTEDGRRKFIKAAAKQLINMEGADIDPSKIHLHFTEAVDFETISALEAELVRLLSENKYDLIIIDAMSDLFGLIDGEINSNTDARKILSLLSRLVSRYHFAVIIIHHSAKTKIDAIRKDGKMFLDKNTSQGAGAITQRPRTVLALSHDKKSITQNGRQYKNYLHVVKANVMGKKYVQNAIELMFDGDSLIHSPTGSLVDIELHENPSEDGPQESRSAMERREITMDMLRECIQSIFSGKKTLKRNDVIRKMKSHLGVNEHDVICHGGHLYSAQLHCFVIASPPDNILPGKSLWAGNLFDSGSHLEDAPF